MARLHIDILTLFPEMLEPALATSIIGRAERSGIVRFGVHNLRDWATDRHRTVDDAPYGGGPGMVMKCEPLASAIRSVSKVTEQQPTVLFPTPDGKQFTQADALRLGRRGRLMFVCGHYEGIDQRIRDTMIDEEFTIGDYVLTGGELPTLVMIDSIVRLLDGALGNPESALEESFSSDGLLDHPHYTRPPIFEGLAVPEVLSSGDHQAIAKWRKNQALRRTFDRRPDLLLRRNIVPTAEFVEMLNWPVAVAVGTEPSLQNERYGPVFQHFEAQSLVAGFQRCALTISQDGHPTLVKGRDQLEWLRPWCAGTVCLPPDDDPAEATENWHWLRSVAALWMPADRKMNLLRICKRGGFQRADQGSIAHWERRKTKGGPLSLPEHFPASLTGLDPEELNQWISQTLKASGIVRKEAPIDRNR